MSSSQFVLPLLGGVLIGLAATLLLWLNGRVMGVSGIWSGLLRWSDGPLWRLAFVAGLVAAPLLLAALGSPGIVEPQVPRLFIVIAGLLVGVGTSLGSGCTSGHGICGISRLSPRSIAATVTFMVVAAAIVYAIRHLLFGG